MAYRIFTVMLLLMAVAILQWHAVAFWQAHTGSLGWMWAVGIEGAAVWLWWQPQKVVRVVGVVASVLSLAGPLHQVGYPVIEAVQQAEAAEVARAARLEVLRGTLQAEKDSLRQYLKLAEKRLGWAGRIDESQERIDKANEELGQLMTFRPSGGLTWGLAVVCMEAVALILLQVVVVFSVRSLVVEPKPVMVHEPPVVDAPVPQPREVAEEPEDVVTLNSELPIPERLQKHLEATGESVASWSRQHELNADRVRQVLAGRAPAEVMQAVGEALS